MSIQKMLGDTPTASFVEQHFGKLPLARANACEDLCELGSWEIARHVLTQESVDALVVRGGERWTENRLPTIEEAQALHAAGYTLVIRHAERHHGRLAELAAGFAADFAAPVDVHLYYTPGGHFGFGWHYDAEDVFILQTAGQKEYALRKNTVNPWPVVENMPADLHHEREIMPLMKCSLSAGDWLYIPAGYWHRAESKQDSISIAVGLMSPTALDLLDHLRWKLAQSLLWRQRLPVAGTACGHTAEELVATYQEIGRELSRDLIMQLQDPIFLQQFMETCRRQSLNDSAAQRDGSTGQNGDS